MAAVNKGLFTEARVLFMAMAKLHMDMALRNPRDRMHSNHVLYLVGQCERRFLMCM